MTTADRRPDAAYLLEPANLDRIYAPEVQARIAELTRVVGRYSAADVTERPERLAGVEIVLSGWGCAKFDAALLASADRLRLVLYGAGSIRGVVSDAFWDATVRICSAWQANAVPVAEFTLAQIILALKCTRQLARDYRSARAKPPIKDVPGAYGSTVGIISLGQIGRRVCRLLAGLEVNVLACDPFASAEQAAELGVRLVSLETLFAESDVVSLHAPWLPQTVGMITGALLASMRPRATFINTARGALVREDELIAVLRQRPDLQAVLDVTYPEPPAADSPLWELPNVELTPHIAGSMGPECRRMGRFMLEELERYLAGEPLQYEVSREQAATMA